MPGLLNPYPPARGGLLNPSDPTAPVGGGLLQYGQNPNPPQSNYILPAWSQWLTQQTRGPNRIGQRFLNNAYSTFVTHANDTARNWALGLGTDGGSFNVGGHELPLNPDGRVTLYHGTRPEGATGIVQSGQLRRAGEPRVYLRTAPTGTGYGTHTVAVDVDPRRLRLDDEFPDGRTDFAIDQPTVTVGNPRIVNRSPAEPRAQTPSDPGYLYHATNTDNAAGIAEDGRMVTHRPDFGTDQDRWPDGGTSKRRYFSANAGRVHSFAPAEGQSVILRVPDSATKFQTERGTGDVFTNKRIPRDQLEILGRDQNWHRLNSFYAQPQRFRTMTRDQPERQPIDDLDRAAYGVAGGDVVQLHPKDIQIDHLDDLANAQDKFDKGGMAWAKRVDQSEPVRVRMQQDGQFHLEDGHHRWLAARKTGQPLRAQVTVKGKPIETILGTQNQNGPLLTDAQGNPQTLYHGTNNDFTDFDPNKIGSGTDSGQLGHGFYFRTDPNVAQGNTYVKTANLQTRNPLNIQLPNMRTDKRFVVRDALGLPKTASRLVVTNAAKQQGYDRVVLDYRPTGYNHREVVVFDKNQIKQLPPSEKKREPN